MSEFYTSVSAMTPFFCEYNLEELIRKSFIITQKSSALGKGIHRITKENISKLILNTNGYYSNLIEGNKTHPLEIQKMLDKHLVSVKNKYLVMENIAHIKTQQHIDKLLFENPAIKVTSPEFLKEIHKYFYEAMQENMIINEVDAGKFRSDNVIVGKHIPPDFHNLNSFMDEFHKRYNYENIHEQNRIISMAASHHRLVWIHPFKDGNGRVARLFSYAYSVAIGLNQDNLWSISRGFARDRERYYLFLENADNTRMGALDGRGNLSDKQLSEFVRYFLDVCLDQIEFISHLLEMDMLLERYDVLIDKMEGISLIEQKDFIVLIKYLIAAGELERGRVGSIIAKSDRTGRNIIKEMTKRGLIFSDTPKSSIKLNFPINISQFLFPKLFPEIYEPDFIKELKMFAKQENISNIFGKLMKNYNEHETDILAYRELVKMLPKKKQNVLFEEIGSLEDINYNELIQILEKHLGNHII